MNKNLKQAFEEIDSIRFYFRLTETEKSKDHRNVKWLSINIAHGFPYFKWGNTQQVNVQLHPQFLVVNQITKFQTFKLQT